VASNPDSEIPQAPGGIPFEYTEHVRLMYDLLALAYRADITRVFTFMMAREASMKTYPEVGITEPHHTISHHREKPDVRMKHASLNTYHMSMVAKFIGKLKATPDGDGTLLDHSLIMYGGCISNGNLHTHGPLPTLLAGGACGQLAGGRHIRTAADTPMANMLVSILEKVGVETDPIGDSTGRLGDL
jgi:hypothetical protein